VVPSERDCQVTGSVCLEEFCSDGAMLAVQEPVTPDRKRSSDPYGCERPLDRPEMSSGLAYVVQQSCLDQVRITLYQGSNVDGMALILDALFVEQSPKLSGEGIADEYLFNRRERPCRQEPEEPSD
jgi:hypothetical protein